MAAESVYIPSKPCKDCGGVFPLTDFHRRSNTKDGRGPYCRSCANTRSKRWAETHQRGRDGANANYTRSWQKARGLIVALKRQSCCAFCGEREPVCLDFHHIDPGSKSVSLAKSHSIQEIVEEAGKCVLICRNCHAKVHAKLLPADDLRPISLDEIDAALNEYGRAYLLNM